MTETELIDLIIDAILEGEHNEWGGNWFDADNTKDVVIDGHYDLVKSAKYLAEQLKLEIDNNA